MPVLTLTHSLAQAGWVVPHEASVQLAGGSVSLGCTDWQIDGQMQMGAGAMVVAARHVSVGSEGVLDIDTGHVQLAQQWSNQGQARASGSGGITRAASANCALDGAPGPVALASPPPPPPPPPAPEPQEPDPVVPQPSVLPSSGGQNTVQPGAVVRISDSGQGGTRIMVSGMGSLRFELGGQVLSVHTGAPDMQLVVLRAADGTLVLAAQEGRVDFSGARQPLLLAGNWLLVGEQADNRLQATYAAGALVSVHQSQGSVQLVASGQPDPRASPAPVTHLHAGESARFDPASGQWLDTYLGSVSGQGTQLGDSLAPATGPWQVSAGVPRLSSLPERQRLAGHSLPLDRQLAALLASHGLPASAQGEQGVMRLSIEPGGEALAAWPLGRVQIAEGQTNGASFEANGTLRVVVNGLALHLAPAVPDPAALARSLAQLQPQGRIRIGADGTWRWQVPGAGLALRPHWALLPAGSRGFAEAAGQPGSVLYSADGQQASLLQPALADYGALLHTARQFDPQAVLEAPVGLPAVLHLAGQRFELLPHSVLTPLPPGYEGVPMWLDGGQLSMPVGAAWVQTLQVR